MERQIKKWFSIVFCVVLVGTMLICLLKPATYFSENENRVLAQMPQASVDSILSGEYTKEIEEYTADQFPMRDSIVGVKAHLEQLSGKQENNGVYFAKEGYLIEKPSTTDLQTAKASMDSIKKVDALGKYNISLLLVPTAYEILRDYLPAHVYEPIQEQVAQLADETFAGTDVTVVDPTEELAAHKGDYIYFRTDHHQTAYGSFLVYQTLCEQLGLTPYSESDFTKEDLSSEFYGTTWSKAALFNAEPDTISVYRPKFDISYSVNYVYEGKQSDSPYEMSWLEKKDKYSMFFDGNHPVVTVETSNKNGKSLAVFKDSYANSILPLLMNHYESVHIIDLRYFNADPLAYLDANGISDMLVLYNTSNFTTDTNVVKLGAFIK